jgi:hypothetical protein
MAAIDHINADQHKNYQLPMFVRATDLVDSLTATADSSYDAPEEVMQEKLKASHRRTGRGAGVYDSVRKEGVLNPVQVIHAMHGNVMMGQGHHRVAAADDISRETGKDMWVPVVHTVADETSDIPLSIYSSTSEKRAVIADHRRAIEDTPAFGHDIMWRHERPQGI